jgi:hypothetical protein
MELFPPMPLASWCDTKQTLHRFSQVIGKIRLAASSRRNHWSNVPFHLTGRGITTRPTATRSLPSTSTSSTTSCASPPWTGPFATDARVWVHGDPTPVVETGDSFGELPRFTYRLDQVELERVRAELAEAGLASSALVPRRLRATRT